MERSQRLPVLEAKDVAVSFAGSTGMPRISAVGGASWAVHAGQMLAIVGESGSGKSVSALSAMGLLAPGARVDRGAMILRAGGVEKDLFRCTQEEMRGIRGKHLAMIFQEPMTSLNPVLSVGEQLLEVIQLHKRMPRNEARGVAIEALRAVRMEKPEMRLGQYPHELSGGMRQRVMIAMAIACQPAALLADEPTTALDVTVQAHILDLLAELRTQRQMAVVLITHDLGVVADHADAVCVMFGGRVVEFGRTAEVLHEPRHPYTRALLACRPRMDRRMERLATVGEIIPAGVGASLRMEGGREVVPWWPFSQPPEGLDQDDAAVLVEVGEARWVAVWPTASAMGLKADQVPMVEPMSLTGL